MQFSIWVLRGHSSPLWFERPVTLAPYFLSTFCGGLGNGSRAPPGLMLLSLGRAGNGPQQRKQDDGNHDDEQHQVQAAHGGTPFSIICTKYAWPELRIGHPFVHSC